MDELNSRAAPGAGQRRIHYWPLDSDDAALIADLQRQLFAAELTEPVAEIQRILRATEEHLVCNFSFGAFDGKRMVGYVFAYIESTSVFHQRAEEVIYIKEIAVLPGYENQLRAMFQKLVQQWLAFAPRLPFEAHALVEALAKWRRMERMFRYYGVALTTREEPRREGRPPYHLLRFDLTDTAVGLTDQPMPLPPELLRTDADIGVSVVTEPRQWLALQDDWAELLRRTPGAGILQSFDYLWRWWRYCGIWHDLRIVVLRRGAIIVGVAPLMIRTLPVPRGVVRVLSFIGAPEASCRPCLLFGLESAACLPVLLGWLDASADTWDVLTLDQQADPGLVRQLRTHFRARGCVVQESVLRLPRVDLSATPSPAAAEATLPRMRLRQFDRMPALVEALDAHCELESREEEDPWRLPGILEDRDTYFFYQSLAEHYGAHGRFVLRTLEQDGRTLASSFGLVDGTIFQTLKFAWRAGAQRRPVEDALGELEYPRLQAQGCTRHAFTDEFAGGRPRRLAASDEVRGLRVLQPRVRRLARRLAARAFRRRLRVRDDAGARFLRWLGGLLPTGSGT